MIGLVAAIALAATLGPPEPYTRTTRGPDAVALEIACRSFKSSQEGAPTVQLVGVAHLGSPEYYDAIEKQLAAHPLVLFESVMPSGARVPGGADDIERAASTRRTMLWLRDLIDRYRVSTGALPTSLDQLGTTAGADSRLSGFVSAVSRDGWGNPFELAAADGGFRLISHGSDGLPGGDGAAEDLRLRERRGKLAQTQDGLQAELAHAIGLSFQLDEVDYAQPNWQCSDMTEDELAAEFAQRGLDFDDFSGSFRTGTIGGDAAASLLRLIKLIDAISNGRVRHMVRAVMAEALGADTSELGLAMGKELREVILDERNAVVWKSLQEALARPEPPKSIAIFYGAAHMADFERRLAELGYQPTDAVWLKCFEADSRIAGLTEEDTAAMREQIQKAMRKPVAGGGD